MPSRSNPNTPRSRKPKGASVLKCKRKHIQHLAAKNSITPVPRTSQAIRKAAPLSRKKARKIGKKIGYARRRAMEEALEAGEVEMKDADDGMKRKGGKEGAKGEAMEVDEVR